MSRKSTSLLSLALAAQLVGCAQPGVALPEASANAGTPLQGAAVPQLAPLRAGSAPAAAASSPAEAVVDAEPSIIRGTDRVVAPQRVPPNPVATGASSRLQFEGAPVTEVVHVMLRDLLKVDYVIHPPLNGTITLTTRQAVTPDRAMTLLEAALQANGIVMARDPSGTYHVGTPEALRGIVSAPVLVTPGQRLPPGYGTIIIPMQYLGAGEMANILRPMVAPDAIQRVDTVRNILVMRGTRAEAEGWLDLVNTFDVNLLRGMSVGVFPLKHTSAVDVEAALRLLSGGTVSGAAAGALGAGAGGRAPNVAQAAQARPTPAAAAAGAGGAAAAGAAASLGENSPLFGALRIMPIERINAIMVVTPRAAYLDEVRYWIEQFDKPNMNSGEPQLFVYKVQNSSADHLAELINGIYGGTVAPGTNATGATGVAPGLNTATGATGGFNQTGSAFGNRNNSFGNNSFGSSGGMGSIGGGGLNARLGQNTLAQRNAQQQTGPTVTLGQNVRVMADRINNTLLIHATPADYARVETTLKRLDVQRAQVLIEASIVEVTLSDGLEYGLAWSFSNGLAGDRTGLGTFKGSANDPLGAATSGTSAAAPGAGFTWTLSNAAGNITAVLHALANKSLIRVISSPSLMVLDNHTAAIQVGNQQPVNVGGTTFNPGSTGVYTSTSIQYKDTGVMLDVTPSISAGDLITLDINQTVTDLDTSGTSATAGYPAFMQRQISSKVSVRSGETMALGGLIKDNAATGSSGLPGLSSIPIIGGLFGTQKKDSSRTELLVVLTPRVVRSDEDARAMSRELRERMRGLTTSGLRNSNPNQGVNGK